MNNSVPTGWSLQPLSALAHYHNGRAFKPEDWSSEGLPIIRIAQINNKNTDLDYYAGDDVSDKNRIINGDLLFSWSATLTALIWNRGDAVLNQHIFKVEEKAGVDRKYLHQVILNSIEPLADYSHGSTMKHIKKGVLDEYCVGTPPLPEQQKIATILSSVDDVIEKTRAQIDKLKDLKTGMMQELLTKGIGHTEFKYSPIGLVPAGWSVIELSNIVQKERPVTYGIVQTGPNSSNGVPCVRVVDLMKSELSTDNMIRTSQEISQQYKRTILQPGDIMFALRGEIGHVCKVEPVLEGANLTRGVALISPNQEVSTEYLLWALRSPGVRQNILDGVNGSALQEIPLGNLRSIKIPVPSIQEQNQIARTMDSIQSKLKEVSLKLDTVKSLKKALMQDLLTGKVRVNLTDKESAVV